MKIPKQGKELVKEISLYQAPVNGLVVWHLNQAGFVIKNETTTIYLDPYLSDDLVNATKGNADQHTRIYLPLLSGSDIDNADYVFCTHDHLDHLDQTTVLQISKASAKTKFVVPLQATRTMERLGIEKSRIIYMEANKTMELPGLKVRAFIGAHETFDIDQDYGYSYLGYHITMGDYYLFHAGDTILIDELVDEVKKYPVDLAFLPINGREYHKLKKNIRGNMNFKEAADFAAEVNADIVFPCHWGMHFENTERPGNFVDYVTEKYRYQKFRVMVPGDRLIYIK